MVKTEKMQEAKLRFATSILKRLGEELNPTPDLGLIELAKNSYDADARKCIIELKNVDSAGGEIHIYDDGNGMNAEDILNGWLVLGRSTKSNRERTKYFKRIPAGSKGLGRLSALRLGKKVQLITRPRKSSSEFKLEIDWEKYEDKSLVDDVTLKLNESSAKRIESHGSIIKVFELRKPLKRSSIKRLARGLILLADPFGDDPTGFKPILISKEFTDLENLVKQRYFDDAEYFLSAELNIDGIATAKVNDWKGNTLFEAGHEELTYKRKGDKKYNCPAAKFDLWVFLLSRDAFSTRKSTIKEVRNWLDEFGGVHLYQNGLRVNPYGNPENDWLSMNLSRARSPEERPSTNTVIGRISVWDENEVLLQKTDRSGFVETEAFDELRSFAQDALEWMARKRLELAEKRRTKQRIEKKKKSQESSKRVDEAIRSAPHRSQVLIKKSFEKYKKARDKEVESLRKEVQLYRTLSTAGITAATFAHESNSNPIKIIDLSIKTIQYAAKKIKQNDFYFQYFEKPIHRIQNALKSFSVLGEATLNLLEHEKRRFGRVDLHQVIKDVASIFEPFLEGRDVELKLILNAPGNPYLRASEAAIESIITNLINNSLNALEGTAIRDREIALETEMINEILFIKVSDNGPGIEEISLSEIWLPGRTTRKNGTGLGLTIVRDSVIDLGGSVSAISRGKLGGATIIIELPILGK